MKPNIAAPHILRLYVWELLKNNSALAEIDGKIPFSSEDDKIFAQSGKPYIIYGYNETTPRESSYMVDGNFAMRLITRDSATAVKISNIIAGALEFGDVAAANINLYSTAKSDSKIDLRGCRFTHARAGYHNIGDEPAQDEGGRMESIVMIEYKYIREHEVKTFDGVSWS